MLKHFVVWTGDVEKDPMDKGCECFDDPEQVVAFVKRETNKGYKCQVFVGKLAWPLPPTDYEVARQLVGELFGKHLVE